MSGVGNIVLDDHEAEALRRVPPQNGGFLMVDDFWGERQWDNFYRAIKQVFPDREPVDLPREPPDLPLPLRHPRRPPAPDDQRRLRRPQPRNRHHLGGAATDAFRTSGRSSTTRAG